MPASRFLVVFLYLFVVPIIAFSQSKFVTFNSLKEKNGLSSNKVYDILHDSKGYIWLGTKDGLNLYDGYNFTVFHNNPGDSNTISSNYVQVLFEDSENNLWIGTYDGGLNLFNRDTRTFKSFKHNPNDSNSISSNNIYDIFEDSNHTLWIGTYGGGLCKFNPEKQNFTIYKHNPDDKNSLSNNAVFDIHEDRSGKLWLATFGGGLCTFDLEYQSFQTFRHEENNPKSLPSNDLFDIAEDKKGNIWIGTYGGGLVKFDRTDMSFITYRQDSHNKSLNLSSYILDLEPDASGKLWIATRDQGIWYLDNATQQFFQFTPGSSSNQKVAINRLSVDKSGLLWVATEGAGVYTTYAPTIAFNYLVSNNSKIPDFYAKSITAVFEDHVQNLWIGTFGDGLYQYNPATKKIINYKSNFFSTNSLAGNFVTSITEDKAGNIWVGTSSSGLSQLDASRKNWQTFLYDNTALNGLNSNSINSLFTDSHGNLWIGTYGGGLSRFSKNTKTFVNIEKESFAAGKSLSHSTITSFFEDEDYLWIGTKESGLFKVNSSTGAYINYITDSTKTNAIPSNEITGITKDYEGNLWIGTFDKGICKFIENEHSFQPFTETNGLVSDNVCGIVAGNDSTLWISTVDGLSRFTPVLQKFDNYDANQGLYNQEFVQWSYFKNKAGKIFFGSLGNLVYFDPQEVEETDYAPPLYNTAFFLYDQQIRFNKPTFKIKDIDLKHDDNFFEFSYALLSYDNPEKIEYAYQMEGLDKDWKYVEDRRLASYTNLDAGHYTFRVKARDRKGIWYEVVNPIAITIHPAWYNTLWFITLCTSIIIGLSVTYYFYQINVVKEKNMLLEAQVAERTSELVKSNLKIQAQAEKINEKNANLIDAQSIIEERNRELNVINEELEDRVEQRTHELTQSNEQLLKANAELDMFIYRSYHDIIGPLARIQGLSKVALMDIKDAASLTYFSMLEENCLEAKTTLHKVLDIYNIRNYDLELSKLDVKEVLNRVVNNISESNTTQFPLIDLQCSFETNTTLETDPKLLESILHSLVENAYRYSEFDDDSFIKICVAGIDDKIVISITDNGIGILPEVQNKLFSMFFKGTIDKSGTGLGLYISRVAAQKMGGDIVFEQSQGVTVFKIIIPRAIKTVAKAHQEKTSTEK